MKATSKTVAILSKAANIAAAIEAVMTPRLPGAKFVQVTSMKDLPEAEDGPVVLASIGIPNYLPDDRVSEVVAVNTAYVKDADERTRQWQALRDENTDTEDIIEMLGNQDGFTVIPKKKKIAVRADFADARTEFAEAALIEDEVEKLTAQLAAMTAQRDLAISVSALR